MEHQYGALCTNRYVFVVNMVGIHAMTLVLMGRFDGSLYLAYTLFYIVGTAGAMQVPVVGLTPLRRARKKGLKREKFFFSASFKLSVCSADAIETCDELKPTSLFVERRSCFCSLSSID